MNSKENTFRALQDTTLLVKSWRCFFKWHKWTMWQQQQRVPFEITKQVRYCVNCNLHNSL